MDINKVDYFYHATGDDENNLKKMLNIIKSGHIFSKRKQGIIDNDLGFNGLDYISIAAWDDSININDRTFFLDSSFGGFIFGLPCFILSNDIPAIMCGSIPADGSNSLVDRVSQYIDEWHVKDEILIEKVVGIALPDFSKYSIEDKLIIDEILRYANKYNWEIFVSNEKLVELVREKFSYKR